MHLPSQSPGFVHEYIASYVIMEHSSIVIHIWINNNLSFHLKLSEYAFLVVRLAL